MRSPNEEEYEILLNLVVMEHDEYDYKNVEVVMLIKVFVTEEMLPTHRM